MMSAATTMMMIRVFLLNWLSSLSNGRLLPVDRRTGDGSVRLCDDKFFPDRQHLKRIDGEKPVHGFGDGVRLFFRLWKGFCTGRAMQVGVTQFVPDQIVFWLMRYLISAMDRPFFRACALQTGW